MCTVELCILPVVLQCTPYDYRLNSDYLPKESKLVQRPVVV